MGASADGELYHDKMIGMLEAIWGEGYLSPGGPDEVARLVGDDDLSGCSILDIGCGAGGIEIALATTHRAGYVTGIDVEDTVLNHARGLVAKAGLEDRVGLVKVAPGALPFPPETFDVVFSKDSIVHIPDKHALMREVFRVLKPGGRFIASDWLIGHDGEPSTQMAEYIKSEGLDFGMASPSCYQAAMEAAGFLGAKTTSRNAWYREVARTELDRLLGPVGEAAAKIVGADFVAEKIGRAHV